MLGQLKTTLAASGEQWNECSFRNHVVTLCLGGGDHHNTSEDYWKPQMSHGMPLYWLLFITNLIELIFFGLKYVIRAMQVKKM